MSLFESIVSGKQYQELLKQLPEDEQAVVLEALRDMVSMFEKNVIKPIENFTDK